MDSVRSLNLQNRWVQPNRCHFFENTPSWYSLGAYQYLIYLWRCLKAAKVNKNKTTCQWQKHHPCLNMLRASINAAAGWCLQLLISNIPILSLPWFCQSSVNLCSYHVLNDSIWVWFEMIDLHFVMHKRYKSPILWVSCCAFVVVRPKHPSPPFVPARHSNHRKNLDHGTSFVVVFWPTKHRRNWIKQNYSSHSKLNLSATDYVSTRKCCSIRLLHAPNWKGQFRKWNAPFFAQCKRSRSWGRGQYPGQTELLPSTATGTWQHNKFPPIHSNQSNTLCSIKNYRVFVLNPTNWKLRL